MSFTHLLLRVYSSIGITENKPLFYYNSLFTLRGDVILVGLKKKVGLGEHVKGGDEWIICLHNLPLQ